MRDPYTPPSAPPKAPSANRAKRPASVRWAMALCWFWLLATYPVYKFSQRVGNFDWLMAIIALAAISALVVSSIAPRSQLRQRALAAVYVLSMLRVAQTILVTLKHSTSVPFSQVAIWLAASTLFMWGILRLHSGSPAARYFAPPKTRDNRP